jgi:hypothetical protein
MRTKPPIQAGSYVRLRRSSILKGSFFNADARCTRTEPVTVDRSERLEVLDVRTDKHVTAYMLKAVRENGCYVFSGILEERTRRA